MPLLLGGTAHTPDLNKEGALPQAGPGSDQSQIERNSQGFVEPGECFGAQCSTPSRQT